MAAARRIFLTGFMASGKTTLGRALAALRGVPFVDLDVAIEQDAGMTVPQIFVAEGEEGFRLREDAMLRRVAAGPAAVIALGGGTFCRHGAAGIVNAAGTSVWLQAPVPCLVRRLRATPGQRPLIDAQPDAQLEAWVCRTLEARSPFYARAHITFDSSTLEDAGQITAAAHALHQTIINHQ